MVRRRKPGPTSGRDVKADIVHAFDGLLRSRRFDELAVADVLEAAEVSRSSFYFYFESKHDLLAELVRRAVGVGHEAAQPWLQVGPGDDPQPGVSSGIRDGAVLWRDQAHVLRAIVEHWRQDPGLAELWTEMMAGYTRITAAKIDADRRAGLTPPDVGHPEHIAAALTWLGERLYYLAAIGLPPFDDQDVLVDTLTTIWMNTLYRRDGWD
jgi:TetR/AcrR family transcriptional regulator, ethionamide resistance regulator